MNIEEHVHWGTNEYERIHYWIKSKYGKASFCEFCNTKTAARFEWALKKGCKYSKNRNAFIQLCKKCHIHYDDVPRKSGLKRKGILHTEEHKKKIRLSCKGVNVGNQHSAVPIIQMTKSGEFVKQWGSMTKASKELHITLSSISMCISGKLKSAGGFKWKKT